MLTIDGKDYWKVSEAAQLAGVNVRTLRRWLAEGNLSHFLFPFRATETGPMYYRLEPPGDGDALWPDGKAYRMQPGKEDMADGGGES